MDNAIEYANNNRGTVALAALSTTVAAGLAALYLTSSQKDDDSSFTKVIPNQSVFVGEKPSNGTAVLRHHAYVDGLLDSFPAHPHIKTLDDMYRHAVVTYPNSNSVGSRVRNADGSPGDFTFKTYKELYEISSQFARGLTKMGLKAQDKVGIYAINCEEWKYAELACYASSLVIVSLYATLGPEAVQFIVGHAETRTVICTPSTFPALMEAIEDLKESPVTTIIVTKPLEEAAVERAQKKNIQLHTYKKIMELGKDEEIVYTPPKPEDLCTIMYTSGTTGEPKGVMLTHRNVIATTAGFQALNPRDGRHDVYLSYLPLAHIMERAAQCNLTYHGSTIGFFSGDIRNLRDDFVALRPTQIVGAPRVYQRVYDNVMSKVEQSPALKKWLFYRAYAAKKKALNEGKTTPLWDKLVFSNLNQQVFGGRADTFISGSAPLSPKVAEFMRVCFSPTVVEGYGMTESTAGCCMQKEEDMQCGTVGPPLPSVELKLVDVPEMNYTSKDQPCPRGELCIRGPGVSQGYYRKPDKTAETWDSDGWLHTGDIARLNADGTLSIIDRAKNIFKLSVGEYVAPEYLENIYSRSPFVAQCLVYGDSFQPVLVSVVVPDQEYIMQYAKQNGIKGGFKQLCEDPAIINATLADMTRVASEAKVNGYEKVKKIHLDSELWSPENNILTPTLKLKRIACKEKYIRQIESMYKELGF